ncbi:MAG: FecR domain-containing protein, partial [Thiohalocapsa sp.]
MIGFGRRPFHGALAAALLLAAASGQLQAQERVGISSAVNPEAIGAPPGAAPRRLVIGQDVIFNEHITTGPTGQTQLLFLDESAMTVGPDSDLVIDQFVYDPKTGTGKLAMSATRGLLRYVGGKLSKQDQGVTVRTATATLAVRGGAFVVNVARNGNTEAIFIFGRGLTVTGTSGASTTLHRPGFSAIVGPGGFISQPVAVPAGQLATYLQQLDGRPGTSGGAAVVPTEATVVRSGLSRTVSTVAPATSVVPIVKEPLAPPPNSNKTINPEPNSAGQILDCVDQGACSLTVITNTTAVKLAGRVKSTNGNGTANGFVDQTAQADAAYSGASLQNGVFTGTVGALGKTKFPLTVGSSTFGPEGTSSALGTFTGTSFLSSDKTFFYASIQPTQQPDERLFITGGTPVNAEFYNATAAASTTTGNNAMPRVFAFEVQPDAALDSTIPFVRPQAGGNLANANVSPLYVIAPATTKIGDASTLSAAHSLQGSLAIDGAGADQRSTIAVSTGTIATLESSKLPILDGQMRGSSRQAATDAPLRLSSAVSSMVDANGNSFYGADAITGFGLD